MLVVKKFGIINPGVSALALVLGAVAGLATACPWIPVSWAVRYAGALAFGIAYCLAVWATYKFWWFRYGVPHPGRCYTELISPYWYKVVVRRYFYLFWGELTLSALVFRAVRRFALRVSPV